MGGLFFINFLKYCLCMTIRKAVAVIFQFSNQIFEIQRQDFLKAFPGYTAFPGGKVDELDKVDSFEDTLLNALFRETKEELGIDIQELQSKNMIRELSLFAKATSPDYNPNRYQKVVPRLHPGPSGI